MKCQKCDRAATFHITDLIDGTPNELHLCEECAQAFLTPSSQEAAEMMPAMAGLLAQHLAVGETADELARLDQRACQHIGKVPKRCPHGADQQTQLIRLRREMKEAVSAEEYERASQLRDEIRGIEASFRQSAIEKESGQ
jgi:protein arginine kinase activator